MKHETSPKFKFVFISINNTAIKFSKQLNEIKWEYQTNIYFFGSDQAYDNFVAKFGKIQRIYGMFELLLDDCDHCYIDEDSLNIVGDVKTMLNHKITVVK